MSICASFLTSHACLGASGQRRCCVWVPMDVLALVLGVKQHVVFGCQWMWLPSVLGVGGA
jgi:hypothetical protein